jgi:hypothetical protein
LRALNPPTPEGFLFPETPLTSNTPDT